MFDQELWRSRITERLGAFARNPRQDIQLSGNTTALAYLAVRALEPFLEAFQQHPVDAVLALAEITRGPGADQIVRRASQMRYQVGQIIERELRSSTDMRAAIEQLLVTLNHLTQRDRDIRPRRVYSATEALTRFGLAIAL
jgi:hypothetical protein